VSDEELEQRERVVAEGDRELACDDLREHPKEGLRQDRDGLTESRREIADDLVVQVLGCGDGYGHEGFSSREPG
jgi:hypothetical protein